MSNQEESKAVRSTGRSNIQRPKTTRGDSQDPYKNDRSRGKQNAGRQRLQEATPDGDIEPRGRGRGRVRREDQKREEDLWRYWFHDENCRKNFDYGLLITTGMEVPVRPKLKVKEPSKEEMNNKLDERDKQIKKLTAKKDRQLISRRSKLNGGQQDGKNGTYREEKQSLIKKHKELKQAKLNLNLQMQDESAAIEKLTAKRRAILKNMDPKYTTESDIKEAIADMYRTQQTTTISGAQEQKLVKEIAKLEKSLPYAIDVDRIEKAMKQHQQKKKEMWEQLHQIRKQVDEKGAEIDRFNSSNDKNRDEQKELSAVIEKINSEIEEISIELNNLYKEKDDIKEEYWEAMFKHREENDMLRWIDWQAEQKEQKKEEEEENKNVIETMKQKLANIKNPLQPEIDTCQYLIGVCNTLKVRSGLAKDPKEEEQKLMDEMATKMNLERQERMVGKGQFEAGKTFQQRRQEEMIVVGSTGKQKKNQKKKTEKVASTQLHTERFSHEVFQIQQFSIIMVSPPNFPPELDDKISELEVKMKELQERGLLKQEQARLDHQKQIEEKAQMQKELAEIGNIKIQEESIMRNKRVRAGRGKGNFGLQRDTGRGQGQRRNEHTKNLNLGEEEEKLQAHDSNREFQEIDDDYSYQPRTTRAETAASKLNQQKKRFEFNDDDFEALV